MQKNTIDEAIADAMAEEEVTKEQESTKSEKQFKEALKRALKDSLGSFVGKEEKEKITIPLEEFVILINKSNDLDRILNAIVSSLELSYSKDDLRLYKDEYTLNAFKILYPEAYNEILAKKLAAHENEGE